MNAMIVHHLIVRGRHMRVIEAGQGSPVLLLHGFTGSADSFRDLMVRMGSVFRVIAVDLPGHGGTESPHHEVPDTMDKVVRDLKEMLNQLALPHVALLGYSMGGRIALAFACEFPDTVNALIMESASPGLPTEQERRERQQQDEVLACQIELHGVEAFIQQWERNPLFLNHVRANPELAAEERAMRLQQRPAGLASSLRGYGTGYQPSYWLRLRDVVCPVLLVTGCEDWKFTQLAQSMLSEFPNAEHVSIPCSGHTVHLEQSKAFYETVVGFLLRV